MTAPADMQAVVFCLGEDRFALPVALVREILDHRTASRLPGAPAWLLGLTDVRGTSVPDLRCRMGLPAQDATLASRVLVVDMADVAGPQATAQAGPLVLGLVVDRVLDVGDFSAAAMEPVPNIGHRWRADYIRAVMRRPDGFVVLLDAARVFADEDTLGALSGLDQAA